VTQGSAKRKTVVTPRSEGLDAFLPGLREAGLGRYLQRHVETGDSRDALRLAVNARTA
jgi:hypothetical protein